MRRIVFLFLATILVYNNLHAQEIEVRLKPEQIRSLRIESKANGFKKLVFNNYDTSIDQYDIISFHSAYPSAKYFDHPLAEQLSRVYSIRLKENTQEFFKQFNDENTFESISLISPPSILYQPDDYDTHLDHYIHLDHINAKQAWNISTGDGIKIAVVEPGTYYNYFESKWDTISSFHPSHVDLVNDVISSTGPINASHKYQHGTRVAGVAAAETDNDEGVSSIGFNATLV